MEFKEYSIESLMRESERLAHTVSKEWNPDAVVYLAKGGYLIGEAFSRYFGSDILEISTKRNMESVKEGSSSFLPVLPLWVRRCMRELEIRIRLKKDAGSSQRKSAYLTSRFDTPENPCRLILVDDSADTGFSLLAAKELLHQRFPKAEIRIAVINSFDACHERLRIDWSLYRNTLLCTPASKDNTEYRRFLDLYENPDALHI